LRAYQQLMVTSSEPVTIAGADVSGSRVPRATMLRLPVRTGGPGGIPDAYLSCLK